VLLLPNLLLSLSLSLAFECEKFIAINVCECVRVVSDL
jgi:hypothetical protein